MAMPLYYARKIWAASVGKHSGQSKIDPTKNWENYLSLIQLKAAKVDVDQNLAKNGWRTSWTLQRLRVTNPIDNQSKYLAETTDPSETPDPVHEAALKLTVNKVSEKVNSK